MQNRRKLEKREQLVCVRKRNIPKMLTDERSDSIYWHRLWRRARNFSLDLDKLKWCSYHHTHFDWKSRGQESRFLHRRHIRVHLAVLSRASLTLTTYVKPYQL